MQAKPTLFFALLLGNIAALAADDPPAQSPSDKDSQQTHKVETTDFQVQLKLSGVFESTEAREVKAGTTQLSSLTIEKALVPGTVVRKGQPIVWFQTERVDQQLKEAQFSLQLAELALQESELAMKQLEQNQNLDRELAQRTRDAARQAYDNFAKTDHERRRLTAEFNLKSSRASLDNALEELKQLEKMYKEDELTEESEEIVLKRARQSVENAKFRFDGAQITAQRSLEQTIPTELAQQEEALARAELAYEKAIKGLEFARQRATVELNRQKTAFAKQESDLAQLQADRKQLVLLSPTDGVVYYGPLNRGRLGDGKQTPKLSKGSSVTSGQVLMTIVNPDTLQIRVDLEEKHLQLISVGDKGRASPTAFPSRHVNARVKSVTFVPFAANKFDCVIAVQLNKDEPRLMPGRTCSTELTVYRNQAALTVPQTAVFTDENQKTYVYVTAKDEPKRRAVTVGVRSNGHAEILAGLKAGESILRDQPNKD